VEIRKFQYQVHNIEGKASSSTFISITYTHRLSAR